MVSELFKGWSFNYEIKLSENVLEKGKEGHQ